MSRQMLMSFFPDVSLHILQRFVPGCVDAFLPHDVALKCPQVVVLLGWIRSPLLGMAALVGIGIGLGGAWKLQNSRDKHGLFFLLGLSSFGLMNVSAIFLHCLTEAPITDYPRESPHWWWTDCYFTGVSGLALWTGSMKHIVTRRRHYAVIDSCFLVGNAFGILAVILFFIRQQSLFLELWYILPLLMASGPVSLMMLGKSRGEHRTACLLVVVGVALALIGITLDAKLCRTFGTTTLDLFQASNLVFWGCDFSFLGIAVWLAHLQMPNNKKKN